MHAGMRGGRHGGRGNAEAGEAGAEAGAEARAHLLGGADSNNGEQGFKVCRESGAACSHIITITIPQTLRCPATMLLIASSISPCSVIQIVSKTTVLAFGNRTPGLGHGTRAIPFM